MALFKIFRGNHASLSAQPKHDGYAYFCTDNGSFHIDYLDENGVLQRKQINDDYINLLLEIDNKVKNIQDGVSPTVDIETITGGHKITITDVNGTETFNIMDGADGYTPVKGKDYSDGVSATHSHPKGRCFNG